MGITISMLIDWFIGTVIGSVIGCVLVFFVIEPFFNWLFDLKGGK